MWDNTLRVLRDPLFGIALSLFLAGGFAHRLARVVLFLGGLAAFIWLLVHNQTFADFTIATVGAVGKVVVVLLIVLAVIAVALIACIGVMYVRAERTPQLPQRRPRRRTGLTAADETLAALGVGPRRAAPLPDQPVDAEQAGELLAAEAQHVHQLAEAVTRLVEGHDADLSMDDNPLRVAAGLARGYFTALTPRRHELRLLHAACNDELDHLAELLVALIPDLDVTPLAEAGATPEFLPNRQDWARLTDELDVRLPYLALRLFCLKRDWREFATVLYKCHYSTTVLAECADEL